MQEQLAAQAAWIQAQEQTRTADVPVPSTDDSLQAAADETQPNTGAEVIEMKSIISEQNATGYDLQGYTSPAKTLQDREPPMTPGDQTGNAQPATQSQSDPGPIGQPADSGDPERGQRRGVEQDNTRTAPPPESANLRPDRKEPRLQLPRQRRSSRSPGWRPHLLSSAGSAVKQPAPQTRAAHQPTCNRCGAPVSDGIAFCYRCGQALMPRASSRGVAKPDREGVVNQRLIEGNPHLRNNIAQERSTLKERGGCQFRRYDQHRGQQPQLQDHLFLVQCSLTWKRAHNVALHQSYNQRNSKNQR